MNLSSNETSPNLLFTKLKIRNLNKILIGNLDVNSLPNKFEKLLCNKPNQTCWYISYGTILSEWLFRTIQLYRNWNREGVMIYICENIFYKLLDKHACPYNIHLFNSILEKVNGYFVEHAPKKVTSQIVYRIFWNL